MIRHTMVFIVVASLALAVMASATPQGAVQDQPAPRVAQHRPQPAPPPDIKSSPAAKFIGTWKGTASHRMPGQAEPHVANVTEHAEYRLGDTAVFFEGRGTIIDDATGQEQVVHDAIGIVRFDPRSHKLMFHGFKTGEPAVETELEVRENGDMVWFMKPAGAPPAAKLRFTISLTDDTWRETGEFSPDDGKTYMPFMEMNLTRVK